MSLDFVLKELDAELVTLEREQQQAFQETLERELSAVSLMQGSEPLPNQKGASLALHSAVVEQIEARNRKPGQGTKVEFQRRKAARKKARVIKKSESYREKLEMKKPHRKLTLKERLKSI